LSERRATWFSWAKRDFPWRQSEDPFAILVAEKLLQQTAAREVVKKAFQTLLETYPTPEQLADASLQDVYLVLAPLGFNYRADELRELCRVLIANHSGKIPSTKKELIALPGVGEYTARAVLCFAHGHDIAIVDTNVARVLYRVFGLTGRFPSNPARRRTLLELADQMIPEGRAKEFNLAILDLAADVCRPNRPKCTLCPISQDCKFFQEGE
jgi:A/G-specific adenine glycosylase